MLGNLVDNACKWAQSRVSIEVTSERQEGDPRKPVVRVVVDDDGPGLSPAEREQVSRRGQRLDETKPGSGLGLSIVVELASLYGGSAHARRPRRSAACAPSWCCRRRDAGGRAGSREQLAMCRFGVAKLSRQRYADQRHHVLILDTGR